MARFRKKPVEVEAYQYTRAMLEAHLFDGAPMPHGLRLLRASHHAGTRTISNAEVICVTIHGHDTPVVYDDWIIAEPDRCHFYPCKPNIFTDTYEAV